MLKDSLISLGIVKSDQHFKQAVTDKIHEVMRLVFLQVKDQIDKRFGCFEILGVDFVLDE